MLNKLEKAMSKYGIEGGFYNDPQMRLPMPEGFKKVEKLLRKVGGKKYMDAVVKKINETASQTLADSRPVIMEHFKNTPQECNQEVKVTKPSEDPKLIEKILPVMKKAHESKGTMASVKKMLKKVRLLKLMYKFKAKMDKMILKAVLTLVDDNWVYLLK